MTPTALDIAFAQWTATALLHDPRADGRGVTIVMADTGIDRDVIRGRHPDHRPFRSFRYAPGTIAESADPPSGPHGTTVADILLTIAPQATLLSVDLFGTGVTETEAVAAAIDFARSLPMPVVVNLSLGVLERNLTPSKRQLLSRAVEAAYFAGITIVAAANNDHPHAISYPAAFAPPLLSVDKSLFTDPLDVRFVPRSGVEFVAHSRGYLGPFVREPATSWAVPHVAGVAARLLSLKPDLRPFEIKAILHRMTTAPSAA